MRRWIAVMACAIFLGASPAWAVRTAVHDAAESSVYRIKMGGMIGRGALNAVTSFMDVLVNTVNGTKAGPPIVGTLTGLAKGVGCGVLRLGSGAVDLTTFWVPGFNGFPVSDSYDNCVGGGGGYASTPPPVEVGSGYPDTSYPTVSQAPEPMSPADAGAIEPAKKSWKK